MATGDDERGAELAFERELLASAASDGVPDAAVGAAWTRFAATLGTTAALAHGIPSASGAGAKLPARSALGWMSLGAVGGGAAVAAVFGVLALRDAPSRHVVAPASAAASAAAAPHSASRAVAAAAPMPSASSSAELAPRSAENDGPLAPPSALKAPNGGRVRAAGEHRALQHTADGASALAAEIALLDEARRAASGGDFERALAVLARYRREHPHGELRRESDVLTMETLSRSGDQAGARRLAREFLAAFPDDPHVPRVREFEE